MTQQNAIKLFEQKQVRSVWDDTTEEWYFSVVDVFLIKSAPAVLKRRQAALIFPFAVIYLFP